MIAEEEKDRIVEQISNLFQGLELDDVADILTVQLAMLVTQGTGEVDEAVEFLDEIRDGAEEIVRTVSFDAGSEDDDPAEAERREPDRR